MSDWIEPYDYREYKKKLYSLFWKITAIIVVMGIVFAYSFSEKQQLILGIIVLLVSFMWLVIYPYLKRKKRKKVRW